MTVDRLNLKDILMRGEAEVVCVQEPYSVTLQLELDSLHSATVVRLLYERVPYHYDATVAILDTPVVEEVMPVTYEIIDVVLYFYLSQRMTFRCKN